jgi:hypothetical protein
MLLRRGFRCQAAPPDLPFDPGGDAAGLERLARKLDHYAFRLFLRGAIQRPDGFAPREATRYLNEEQAEEHAEELLRLGLGERLADGRYRLLRPARSFGGVLEWYVARGLRHRLGFEVATGLRLQGSEPGGDLDVVATAEGRLLYCEVKSSPPKNLEPGEVQAFLERLRALRPDLALFVVDTALRLGDKVVPMLAREVSRNRSPVQPRRIVRELWAVTPHFYAVNAHRDLLANLERAVGEGLRALAPPAP